ncbi:MDR family MFS transporter [Streptomyces sp. NPDC001205]
MDKLISSDPAYIGPYRLIARLGAGGMGLVYLGRSEAGRTVAVKVVQAEHAQHPEFRRRFAREVAAARRVGGAWTATVLDADTEAAVPWVATQYIPGPDLTTVVGKDFGPLPENSVRVLANRLALALQAVHGAGLIHRDLKPSNVLVTVDGPRVIDFGIARAMDSLAGDSLHTRTGMLIGSPGFMSPEQVRGLELTPASDVFCLGAVLVHAATGRLLFGATETGLNAHLFRVAEEEADLTGVPASLLDLVRQCLDKDPAKRPTPQQVADRTAAATGGEWLPGAVLAQLGRHAAQLLDYAPETPVMAPADASPADPRVASQAPHPSAPPPPAYAPTTPAYPVPPPRPAPHSPAQDVPLPHPRRWWGLAVVALVQLSVLLDAASFNMALPSVMADLRMPASAASWLFTAYALAFGTLLLLGGHLADLVGRKRMLIVGLVGFAVAGAMGGAAQSAGTLVASRAVQGAFAALLTPAALALVTANFPEAKARGRAFGVYASVTAGGSCLGFFTGGLLVEGLDWRLSLYLDVPLAVIAVIGAATLVHDRPLHTPRRLDLPGLLLGSAGIAALIYGLHETDPRGWADLRVLVLFAVGLALLTAFVFWQFHTSRPPLAAYVPRDRDRLGSLVTLLLAAAGGAVLLPALSSHLQSDLGYGPARSSQLLLPTAVAVVLGATQVSARLLHRVAPRALIVPGLLTSALGLALLTSLKANSAYATLPLPGMLLTGFGLGVALMPLYAIATGGVAVQDCGKGAATTNAAAQVGGVFGTALCGSVLAATITSALRSTSGLPPALANAARGGNLNNRGLPSTFAHLLRQATLNGYTDALWWSAGLTLLAALAAAVLIRSTPR